MKNEMCMHELGLLRTPLRIEKEQEKERKMIVRSAEPFHGQGKKDMV